MTLTIYILGAFVIGFLIGDRRGVRQANEILDANMKVLLEAITDERNPAEVEEPNAIWPTVH